MEKLETDLKTLLETRIVLNQRAKTVDYLMSTFSNAQKSNAESIIEAAFYGFSDWASGQSDEDCDPGWQNHEVELIPHLVREYELCEGKFSESGTTRECLYIVVLNHILQQALIGLNEQIQGKISLNGEV